jgi:hypothetical protein
MRPECDAGEEEKGQHMNPSTRKSTRKAMRVATVFTGAAAVGAFAPAAVAAVGHEAGTGHQARAVDKAPALPRVHGTTHGIRPDFSGRESGSIRLSRFCSQVPHWVHMQSYSLKNSYCYGFKGLWEWDPAAKMYGECGGNNFGYLYPDGGNAFSFHQGTTYRRWTNGIKLFDIRISGWSGNDKCPQA